VAIFGTGLASAAVSAPSVPFPTRLGSVSVTVAGITAPLSYVSATQINALIPFEAATLSGSQTAVVPVVVTTPSGASSPFTITLARNAPAIYTMNLSGSGAALAFDANFSPITTLGTAPIVLYATGLGPTSPPASTNSLGGGTEPLNRVVDNVDRIDRRERSHGPLCRTGAWSSEHLSTEYRAARSDQHGERADGNIACGWAILVAGDPNELWRLRQYSPQPRHIHGDVRTLRR